MAISRLNSIVVYSKLNSKLLNILNRICSSFPDKIMRPFFFQVSRTILTHFSNCSKLYITVLIDILNLVNTKLLYARD